MVKSKLMKVISVIDEKVKEVEARLVKSQYFAFLKRNGEIFTVLISDAKETTLMPIIRQKVMPDSFVYTDMWRSYSTMDLSEFRHDRINHSKLSSDKQNHINGH